MLLYHHDLLNSSFLHLGPKRLKRRSQLKYCCSHLRFSNLVNSQQCIQLLRSISQLAIPNPNPSHRSGLHKMLRILNSNDLIPNNKRLPAKWFQNNGPLHNSRSNNSLPLLPPPLNPRQTTTINNLRTKHPTQRNRLKHSKILQNQR